jgi:hypothetical protein
MLTFARYLFDLIRVPRARALDVRDVRRRLSAQPALGAVSDEEARIALHLRRLREDLSGAFGAPQACGACARPPSRDWPGGDCCKAPSRGLFTDDELAALRLSGTTPARLKPANADRDGCPFCGRDGCSLAPADRPNVCVRYVCRAVEAELRRRGDRGQIAELQTELQRAFDRFVAVRLARIEAGAHEGVIG